jgi:hypothetical protein
MRSPDQAKPCHSTRPRSMLRFQIARGYLERGAEHPNTEANVEFFTASPPMRLSSPGFPQADDFGSLSSRC